MVEAIATGRTDARDILAAVTPRDSLRLQAEEAFADPTWRAAFAACPYGHSRGADPA